ncbi:MAG: alpha-ketoacid dehydrogenase subunit beta [Lachnospiraceae bacterium]|nr:alpha-ketoacid dehydrogenase subunit beta [Lachnospiraceae bacterium]
MSRIINHIQAKHEAYVEEMRRDEKVIILGEDLEHVGCMNGVSRGLFEEFGKTRVIQTALAENGPSYFAVGLAFAGYRPLMEFEFLEAAGWTFSSIIYEAAKQRYMTYGALSCPIMFSLPQGSGMGVGGNHASVGEAIFCNAPGLKVYAPLFPYDIKGLAKYAIREDDPVVFLDVKRQIEGEVPDEGIDYVVEPGKARIVSEGSDITIVGWQYGVMVAMEAEAELKNMGISAEILDLRTLVPMDEEAICRSVQKTGKLLVVSESRARGGFGNEVVRVVAQNCFSSLQGNHPVEYIGCKDYPIPYGPGDKFVLPQKEDVIAAVQRML